VNFDESDGDDRLEFDENQGATGACWNSRKPIVCNISKETVQFAADWNMDKYQQNCVRKDRKTLLSMPIVPIDDWDSEKFCVLPNKQPLGIMNIDTDGDRVDLFGTAVSFAVQCMFLVVDPLNQKL
jgi:hypothetical protein